MPTYKVGFPLIVVEAPDEKAARRYYHWQVTGCWGFSEVSAEEVTDEIADFTVAAEGDEIEEEEE